MPTTPDKPAQVPEAGASVGPGGLERALWEQARQLEAIFAHSLECIVLLDADYNFIRVNEAYARSCGRAPADFIGRNHFEFYPSDTEALFDSVMATRKPLETFARPFVFPDHPEWGTTYWDWTLVPIMGQDEQVEFLLFTLRDVTQRKRAELELAERRKALESLLSQRDHEVVSLQHDLRRQERLAALGQLLATVGHELRTPLGTIHTSIHLLRQILPAPDTRTERILERVERNVRRCHGIIEDLLDYTRLTPLDLKETALEDWLPGVMNEQPLPPEVSLVSVINPITVRIDRDRMTRCVNNVVSNALHAMEAVKTRAHRLTVEVRTSRDRAELRFTDTGVGIAPNALKQVLEPLYSTKTLGVGLGLPIVQQIMARHHGGLEIDSVLGEGTTVTLWLPLHE